MKKKLFVLFTILLPATAQLPFVVTTPTELSSLGRFNSDGLLDVAVLDRASGAVRVGTQNPDGTLTWQATQFSGVANATAMAVGTLAIGGLDALAITSPEWNQISYLNNSGNLSPLEGSGIAPTALAPGGTGQSLSTPIISASNHITQTPIIGSWQWSSGTSLTQKVAPVLTSGNAITLDNGQRAAIFLDDATHELQLWKYYGGATGIKKESVLTGLPAQPQIIAAAFTSNPDYQIIYHAPASTTFYSAQIQSVAGGYSIGTPLAVTAPFAIGSLRSIAHPTGSWLLVISTNGLTAELMNFNPVTGLLTTRQAFTAGAGRTFQTASSAGDGHLFLLEGTSGRTTHWQRAHYNGISHSLTSSGELPTLASSPAMAGTPNLYSFTVEPWVNAEAAPTRYFRAGDWSVSATAGMTGILQVNILTDGGTTDGLGSPSTQSVSGSSPGDAILTSQVSTDIALGTIGGSVGIPRQELQFDPLPGTYLTPETPVPLVSPNPFALRVSLSFPSTHIAYYRFNATSPWQLYDSTNFPGLETTTNIQAFAIHAMTGSATPIVTGTYTFTANPQPLVPAGFVDTDNDGLSDAWENAFAQNDPQADPDNDGLTNLQEQALGSDPLNPLSPTPTNGELPPLTITLLSSPARVVLTWTSSESLILEKSPDMNQNWTTISSGISVINNIHECVIPLAGEPTKQFFRLRRNVP